MDNTVRIGVLFEIFLSFYESNLGIFGGNRHDAEVFLVSRHPKVFIGTL